MDGVQLSQGYSHFEEAVSPQMLPFSDDYLHAKNLRYRLMPSRDIDDQTVL